MKKAAHVLETKEDIVDEAPAIRRQTEGQIVTSNHLTNVPVTVFDLSRKMVNVGLNVGLQSAKFKAMMTPTVGDITSVLNTVAKRTTAVLLAAVQESFATGIFSDLIKLVQDHKNAQKPFNEAGWTIAPSMPDELLQRITESYKQNGKRDISRIIMGYYKRHDCRHLIETVESWKAHPLFAPRMHILRDALQAHREGRYTLSVPALMPQIEGILNDYVYENDLPAKFGRIKEVYSAALEDVDIRRVSTWTITNTLLYQLSTNTYAYTDFESELEKPIHTRQTTRHTVLHGVALKYDKQSHSLKALLLLDALSVLRDVKKQTGKGVAKNATN